MSVTIAGVLVSLLAYILRQAGLPYVPEELEQIITGITQVVGLLIAWYGRIRKGDLTLIGTRKAA